MPEYYDSISATVNQGEENRVVNRALTKYPEPYLSGLKLEGGIELWNPATETSLTFNTIDSNEVVWVVTDITGWWTLPDSEIPDLPRGWGDGSYNAVGRFANRLLTLEGSFMPQGPEDAATARNTLIEYLTPMVKEATAGYLIVTEDGTTKKAAKVRLSGTPQITSVNARGRHDFSIGLKAVDPIKYEFVAGDPDGYQTTTITTTAGSGSATITNSGNIEVPIIIETSLGFSIPDANNPPTITNTTRDEAINIIGATDSDKKLEIDTYNREVLDVQYSGSSVLDVANGRSKVSVLVDWIYLSPGTNTITLQDFPTGGSVVVYYRSGWIG